MPDPTPADLALGRELSASIDATLRAEARRNEQRLAWVRVAAVLGVSGTELWYLITVPAVPAWYRLPTLVFLLVSIGLSVALSRGWYRRAVGIVMPAVDGLYILFRLQLTFSFYEIAQLERTMELVTVAMASALLITSGGFRLSRASVAASTTTGMALYVWFAMQTRLDWAQVSVHVVVLAGVAFTTLLLTRQVRRAVRSEVAKVTLSRFLPAALLDGVRDDPISLVTRPRAVRATVVVTDIRGFTRWAEARSPIEVLDALNVVQGCLAAVVRDHGGMVDKFMGDGMLAVFGTPEPATDHADRAVCAALEMRAAVRELAHAGEIDFQVGIGVHSGELVVGCLGSGMRMEFTVLGDTVNIASRLEAQTKEEGVELLVSGATVAEAGEHGLVLRGTVTLRGRGEPLEVWTLPRQEPVD